MIKSKNKIPKKAKTPISKIQRQIWEECKRIIRAKYGNTCYTCGKTGLEGSGWHTGHFIPKGSCGAFLKYDFRNLRPQCYFCNINMGGNGTAFYRNMVEREGQEYVDKLFQDKNITLKAYDFYLELLEKYKSM